uniref:Uncharacterized protein n=1 Tax=Petalonia binghamiae TaxID=698476 RepID=A0A2H4ZR02_9PHAE|nr:hypothetical protein PebiMp14 [Endarachne binghamiae]AUG32980.1 hypothetical protein PebiMp14 [Endarachne binghamiae]
MFTPRKRHLREKNIFLHKQQTFALFNGSNLKTSQINKIKLSLVGGKLYSVPLYLKPPKLGLGCPVIVIIYDKLEALRVNITKITPMVDCLGICIDKKWYPVKIFKDDNVRNQNKKILSLFLYKKKKMK